ncbi:MAG: hypothetical protein JWN61_307 [Pseudonocardiales bacterium]|nr:hypothetical protein [Jatrophihabitantaceae bacterium]MCW2602172.1 hypothetical protein [Pseudonocardiales bacterium]
MSDTSESIGTTKPAGEGLSDEEMAEQVADQTDSNLQVKDFFEREADGATTDTAAADADADEVK